MGVKIKVTTSKDEFPKMEKSISDLNGLKVNVGVLGGEHAWLASIHEYGCKIPVTPKMRAFFRYKFGINLKKTTTEITIPERSFLRKGFDEHHEKVLKDAEGTLPDVLIGTLSTEQHAEIVGLLLSTAIKEYAVNLREPANSSLTVQQKGSSNPLVDTGDMINGITYEVASE